MTREEIIARLRENEAALFGSRVRGEHRPDSDTDIMIEIDPDAPVGLWEYAGIKAYIVSLFEGQVDVVDREGLNTLCTKMQTMQNPCPWLPVPRSRKWNVTISSAFVGKQAAGDFGQALTGDGHWSRCGTSLKWG